MFALALAVAIQDAPPVLATVCDQLDPDQGHESSVTSTTMAQPSNIDYQHRCTDAPGKLGARSHDSQVCQPPVRAAFVRDAALRAGPLHAVVGALTILGAPGAHLLELLAA
ncbi:hypothetical protein GCM10023169_22390 [Georgenia halophila]|uniref:Secreted protein n=1 Tax=Georgenia halophila TaxID=620889 RepID=A0ABP8LA43_9MICO